MSDLIKMKELFIPYELALLAKEKGFNEPCFGWHNLDENKVSLFNEYPFDGIRNFNSTHLISAPLYQQIIDFFRVKHGIILDIDFGIGWGFGFIAHGSEKNLPNNFTEGFETYYEALKEAISEAFKLIP